MNTKKQIILFWVICLIMAFAIIWFFVIPLFKTISQISSEFVNVNKELAIINNETREIKDTEDICDKIDPDLQKAEDLFVSKDVPIKVIEFLENVATISDLLIEISPSSLDDYKDSAWDFVGFRLVLYGSYVNFMRFLEKIETGPFLIETYNLSIKEISGYKEFSSGDISAVLIIKVFAK